MSRGKPSPAPTPSPRRQARGKKRIAELLRAAGEVFAEVGYENATTNAIAAKAGVSPGTLYQFFPNKQAMAEALAEDYAVKNKAMHDRAFAQADQLTFHAFIGRVIDSFLEFRKDSPGLDALFTGSVVSRELAARIQTLHSELKQRIANLILSRRPRLPQATVQMYAEVSMQIFKGLLPLALAGSPEQKKAGAEQLKAVLERYLAPIVEGESS